MDRKMITDSNSLPQFTPWFTQQNDVPKLSFFYSKISTSSLELTLHGIVAHLMTMMEKTLAETPKRTMAARTYPSPTRWNSSTVE